MPCAGPYLFCLYEVLVLRCLEGGGGACEGDRRWFESGEAGFGGWAVWVFKRTIMSMQISTL